MSNPSGIVQSSSPTFGDDVGPSLEVFSIVMIVVSTLAVCFRFWSRSFNPRLSRLSSRFWWDDWICLMALPWTVASGSTVIAMIRLGLGHHITDIPLQNLGPIFKLLFAAELIYDTGLALCRLSALFFYTRIFPPNRSPRWFKICLYTTQAMNLSWWVGIIIGTVFNCNPVAKAWDASLPGHCNPAIISWVLSAVFSVLVDLCILILPMPLIWSLYTTRARKASLTIIFFFGYSVVVLSTGRMIVNIKQSSGLDADFTYESVPILYWLLAEISISTLVICLPAMSNLGTRVTSRFSPLASRVRSIFGSSRGGSVAEGASQDVVQERVDLKYDEKPHHFMDEKLETSTGGVSGYSVYATHADEKVGDVESNNRPGYGIRVENSYSVQEVSK